MIVYPEHRHGSVRDAWASIQHPGMKVYSKHRHGSFRNVGASGQHPGMKVCPKHSHDPVSNDGASIWYLASSYESVSKHGLGSVRDAGASIQHPGMKVYPKAQTWRCQECWSQYPAFRFESVSQSTDMTMSEILEPVSRSMYNVQTYPDPDYARNSRSMKFSVFIFM
jgi:hypothetical protein